MIVISPYSKKMPSGQSCAKDYPFWEQLIKLLPGPIVQIGLKGEVPLVEDFRTYSFPELKEFIKEMTFFISVDNFFPHFCHHYGRHGIVLFGTSDPNLFGYPDNVNLLKDRSYLRPDQFLWWYDEKQNPNAFVSPEKVAEIANTLHGIIQAG
jgi:ADP-heptose:LPS heptosyltransferase